MVEVRNLMMIGDQLAISSTDGSIPAAVEWTSVEMGRLKYTVRWMWPIPVVKRKRTQKENGGREQASQEEENDRC